MTDTDKLADGIYDTLYSMSEVDSNGHHANVVDALFAIARAIDNNTQALPLDHLEHYNYKRPHYAAEVETIIRNGGQPDIKLFAGKDSLVKAKEYRRSQGFASTLMLPPGADPYAYKWPAADSVRLKAETDEAETLQLIRALLRDGVRVVVNTIGPCTTYHYAERNQPDAATQKKYFLHDLIKPSAAK